MECVLQNHEIPSIRAFNLKLKELKNTYLGDLLFLQHELYRAWKNPPEDYYLNYSKRKKVIQLTIMLHKIIRTLKSYPMKSQGRYYPNLNRMESIIRNTMMEIVYKIKNK